MKKPVQNRSTKYDQTAMEIPMACADEKTAVEFMENKRWGDSPCCPHCGGLNPYKMKDSKTGARQANYRWRCHDCKEQYTVRIGTVFEDSRIPMRHWCYAFWRASTSKKGVSALEIHRHTGVSYKSALFMLQRIRFAMADSVTTPLSGKVEVDETYVGGKSRKKGRGGDKTLVMAMVERKGRVKTIVSAKNFKEIIRQNVDKNSAIFTDEYKAYKGIGREYAGGHQTVCHSAGEFGRGDVHSNTVEGFFSIVKRGIHGIYHSVSPYYLPLYMAEFEFRYNHRELEDGERMVAAIRASQGGKLSFCEVGEA